MIFVTHFGSGKAGKDYHGHLSRGDGREYHAADMERLAPVYEGETARMLHIEGLAADQKSFFSLCDNENPLTGERLTERTRQDRRSMTDLTFDVPKSVSLAGLVDPRVKKAIEASIDETMRDIEAEMCVRVRKDGKNEDRVSGNALWVKWEHDTSRPLEDGSVDPQKHYHVTVMNVSYDREEKTYKACQFGNIVRDKGLHQSAFHARVGARLASLGYGVEKDGNSFRLAGIEKALCENFSRRTAVILKTAADKGVTDPAQKAKLGKLTRNKKGEELGTEALRQEWLARMTPEERRSLKEAGSGKHKAVPITAESAVQYAIDHSFERVSTISEARLKGEALRYGVGSVLPVNVDGAMNARKDIIRVKREGQIMVTTKDVLQGEIDMLAYARQGHGQCKPIGNVELLPETLSADQGAAAAHILQSRDRVTGLIGKAGTGKTTTLKAIVQGTQGRAFGCAPSANAAEELRKVGLKNAVTLEKLLVDQRLQEQLRGRVIIADEAGMIGSRDMQRLFKVVKERDAQLVLSGDYRQHGSVQAGDSFRILESEAGIKYARLNTIRRQKTMGYRRAVEEISKGTRAGVQKGFDALDRMECIVEASGEARHKLLVNDYLESVKDGMSALIIAPTHYEGNKLTGELREALKAEGKLGEEQTFITRKAVNWTEAEKGDARNYQPGMVIEWHQNAKGGFKRGEAGVVAGVDAGKVNVLRQDGSYAELPVNAASRFQVYRAEPLALAKGDRLRILKNDRKLKVNNGDIVTVAGFTPEGNISLGDGKSIPKTYGHIGMGYVDTSYGSQGKTVDRVFIAAGDASVLAVNQQQWYVSVSRGKESCRVYVDSKQDVRDAIARSGQRLSAVELVKPERKPPMQERLERNRVLGYLKQRAESLVQTWRNRVGRERGGTQQYG